MRVWHRFRCSDTETPRLLVKVSSLAPERAQEGAGRNAFTKAHADPCGVRHEKCKWVKPLCFSVAAFILPSAVGSAFYQHRPVLTILPACHLREHVGVAADCV